MRICALSLDFSLYNYKSPLTTVSAVHSWFDSIRQLHLSSCCCRSNAQVMDCLTIPVTRSRYNCNGSFKAQKHVLSIKLVEVFLRKRRTSFSNCTEKKGERESTFHNFRKCSKIYLGLHLLNSSCRKALFREDGTLTRGVFLPGPLTPI